MPVPTFIPSPTRGEWSLGPFPIRAYALCIVVGIIVAWWISTRRYEERGGRPGAIVDVTLWAVPFGIVGGRLYHVLTSYEQYFGPGGQPVRALYIWEGGMGIWGAVALGALGAWIGAHRAGVRLTPVADALAPGILVAQGIGRLGNWFNHELFGAPTDLPWGLRVSEQAARDAGYPPDTLFHPAFLYEMLWNLAAAGLLILADRRWRLGHGRVFALYMVVYSMGRGFIESLRIDTAHHVGGLRLNVWTSIAVGLAGAIALAVSAVRHPGRDTDLDLPGRSPAPADQGEAADGGGAGDGGHG
ncbi:MAG: prolipoprotein diacylglyceryl transferase [Bifidobacteriaceae bacterium]|nr:prolipoprotein diacylglyceryl transferase [Bifidobacteriaceae bacterium]